MSTTNTAAAPATDINALLARIAELELAAQANKKAPSISFKVTEKGGVSMYGLGRFPVTLYGSQWDALISAVPKLQVFLKDNVAKLATKPAK